MVQITPKVDKARKCVHAIAMCLTHAGFQILHTRPHKYQFYRVHSQLIIHHVCILLL